MGEILEKRHLSVGPLRDCAQDCAEIFGHWLVAFQAIENQANYFLKIRLEQEDILVRWIVVAFLRNGTPIGVEFSRTLFLRA